MGWVKPKFSLLPLHNLGSSSLAPDPLHSWLLRFSVVSGCPGVRESLLWCQPASFLPQAEVHILVVFFQPLCSESALPPSRADNNIYWVQDKCSLEFHVSSARWSSHTPGSRRNSEPHSKSDIINKFWMAFFTILTFILSCFYETSTNIVQNYKPVSYKDNKLQLVMWQYLSSRLYFEIL